MKRSYGHISVAMILSALIGFGAGLMIVFPFSGTTIGSQYQRGFEAGFEDARLKLAESGLLPVEPEELTAISGIVTAVKGSVITLKSEPVTLNPLAPPAPIERSILLTSDTKLTRLTPKAADQFSREQNAWVASLSKLKTGEKPADPPASKLETSAALSEITSGVRLTVHSDLNIKMLRKIEAKSLQIQ